MLNDIFSKYCAPSEHLTLGEVIVLVKRILSFKQHTPEKQNWFGIKGYELSDMSGCTNDMHI
jgi:hypothetical protein